MKIPENLLPIHRGMFDEEYDADVALAIEDYIMLAANNFPEVIKLLETVKLDAEMALNDTWDRSDEGFKAQIENIDTFLKKIK